MGLAYEIPDFKLGIFPANVDLSVEATYQFTGVKLVTASGAGITTNAALAPVASCGDPIIGVLQNNPQVGEAGDVMQTGVSKVLLGDVASIMTKLAATPSNGFGPAASGQYAVALALEAGVAGDLVAALLVNLGKV